MKFLFRYFIITCCISCGENPLSVDDRTDKIKRMINKIESISSNEERLKFFNDSNFDGKIAYAMCVVKNENMKNCDEIKNHIKDTKSLEQFLSDEKNKLEIYNLCNNMNYDYNRVINVLESLVQRQNKINQFLSIDDWLKNYPKSNFIEELKLIKPSEYFNIDQLQKLRNNVKINTVYLTSKDLCKELLPKIKDNVTKIQGCLRIVLDLINTSDKLNKDEIDLLLNCEFYINNDDFVAFLNKITTIDFVLYQDIYNYLTKYLKKEKLTSEAMCLFIDKFDDDLFCNILQNSNEMEYEKLISFVKDENFQYLNDTKSFIKLIKNNENDIIVKKYFTQYINKKLKIQEIKDFEQIIRNKIFITKLYKEDFYWNSIENGKFTIDILHNNVCKEENGSKNLLDKINELSGNQYITIFKCVFEKLKKGSISINDFSNLIDNIISINNDSNDSIDNNDLIILLLSGLKSGDYITTNELLEKIYKLTRAFNSDFYKQLNQKIKIDKTNNKISVKQNKDFIETYFRKGFDDFRYNITDIAQDILECFKYYDDSSDEEKEAVKDFFKFLIIKKKINDDNWEIFFKNNAIIPDDFLNNTDHDIQNILFQYAKTDTIKKMFESSDNYIGFSKNEYDRMSKENFNNLIKYHTECFVFLFNRLDFNTQLKSVFNNKIDAICDKIIVLTPVMSSLNEPEKRQAKDKYRKNIFETCYQHLNLDGTANSPLCKFFAKIVGLYGETPKTVIYSPVPPVPPVPPAPNTLYLINNDQDDRKKIYDEVNSWV